MEKPEKDEEIGRPTRKASGISHMSVEDPVSPASDSSDSIYESSKHDEEVEAYFRDNQLRPTISRASSTNAVGGVVSGLERTFTGKSTATNDPAFEVDFEDGDKSNPQNWSLAYKCLVIGVMSYSTTCVVLFSTSYTVAIPGLEVAFGISSELGVVGLTTYMIGIAVGAVVLAPLSEMYGRRPIYVVSLGFFILFVLPCALAQNIETILIVRFFGAFCASALVSNAPGSVNDIVSEKYRALAFSIWSIGPLNGPVIGPVVGGFVFQYAGSPSWRWTFWVVLIAVASCWITVSLIVETYSPAILRKKAKKRRKETGETRYFSRYDDKVAFWPLLKENLSRPFIMAVTEPICIFWDVYVALVYGILYLAFVAYPIVFGELRGWSPGFVGLSYCGIGVGSLMTIACEPLIRKWINSHELDPVTGKVPPEAMVAPVCLAAFLIPAGEIWFAWTCTPNVHWVVPIVAGIPFGGGNALVFIYASSYLVNSYDIYAASALAGNAVLRSVMGAAIPLAGASMYSSLGANWAGTLCGLLEAACIPIPFVFYRYGHKIREKSVLIRRMRENKERAESKRQKTVEKLKRRAEVDNSEGSAKHVSMDGGETIVTGRAKDLEKAEGEVGVSS